MANDVENVAEAAESGEQPNPQFSEQKQTQSSGQADDLLESLLPKLRDGLREDMEAIAEKQWQSGKDRRISQHETRLDSLEDTLAEYERLKDSGLSPAEAKREMSLNQTVQSLKSEIKELKSGKVSNEVPGTNQTSWREKQQAILNDIGLDKSDPRVIQFAQSQKWGSPDEYIAALDKKSFEWDLENKSKPKPSASTIANTGAEVQGDSDAGSVEKYKRDMLAARGDARKIKEIKEAARKNGVPVDQIGFV